MAEDNLTTIEQWLPVVGYEEWYEVSNQGCMRRLRASQGTSLGRMLNPSINKEGYLRVIVSMKGKNRKRCFLHAIVAAAFIGPRPEGYHVNHKDGIKTNNFSSNLEYLTPAEHGRHSAFMGLTAKGQRNGAYTHPERRPRGLRNGKYTKPECTPRGDRNGSRLHPEKLKRGEDNPSSKLKEENIREIRRAFISGENRADLARRFQVTRRTIVLIILRESWTHVK